MDKNNIDFLNDKRTPTPTMIFDAFSIEFPKDFDFNDAEFITNITEDEWEELNDPDDEKILEGTEWIVKRLLWNTPKGIVVKFEIKKINDDFEEIIDIDYEDISDKIGEEDFILNYDELLEKAIENEDYFEASRLRDWKIDLIKLSPSPARFIKYPE